MQAMSAFFDFDGRLGRLDFVWRCAVLAGVADCLAVFGRAVLMVAIGPEGLFGVRTWADWGVVAIVAVAAWSALSLVSRRLRDIGAEPAWVVPAAGFAISLFAALGEPLVRWAPPPFDAPEPASLGALALAAAALAVWPRGGARPAAETPRFDPRVPTAYVNWRESRLPDGAETKP